MRQEDKELLLKDLCARLPYGVKAKYYGSAEECECCDTIEAIYPTDNEVVIGQYGLPIDDIKPYLFPLSSMTIEQRYELHDLIHNLNVLAINGEIGDWIVSSSEIDWYNKNHFDYRGLISMGLALDATDKNIY